MAPPPPDLIPDSVAEILLRLPPSDPATLVRASAVCKPWLRTLTDLAFLRCYRAFHRMTLVLGFLRNPDDRDLSRFVPDAAFRQPPATTAGHRTCHVLDFRHGRALLYDFRSYEFVCWDPVTGQRAGSATGSPTSTPTTRCSAPPGAWGVTLEVMFPEHWERGTGTRNTIL
jgi:hypothetical protein